MYKALIFLVLYLPFQLALNPAQGVDLASIRILILFLFCFWLVQGLKNKSILINSSMQTLLVGSFLFLNLMSIAMARNVDWSGRKLLFLFSIFPIYFVASQVIMNKERLINVIKTLVFSGFVVALVGVLQFMLQFFYGLKATYALWAKTIIIPFLGTSFGEAVLKNPSWLVNISGKTYLRATSFFPDPHMFSFYLGLVLPLAIGLIFYTPKRKTAYFIMAIIIFLADIFTFSRGGYLGLFAGSIFLAIFFWNRIQKKYKLVTTLILSIIFFMLFVPSPISERFTSSFNLKEGSNKGRIEMWEKASGIIREKPLLGVGIGNYPLEVRATASYRDPIYAHNTYLDIAVETGIINSLIWVSLLIVTMVSFWKKAKKESIFLFLLVSLIVFATHSLVETALYSPVVLTLFLIIISFSQIKMHEEKNI